jgi:carbonic anhydrase
MAYVLVLSCLLAAAVPAFTSSGEAFNYLAGGEDWPGVCDTGRQQSPVNLFSSDVAPAMPARPLNLTFGTGVNVTVVNLGDQVRVDFKQGTPSTASMTLGMFYGQPNVTGPFNGTNVPAETVMNVQPLQFHFHINSEHTLEGRYAALEAHLVTNVTAANTPCAKGCPAVFGVLYDFTPTRENSTFLAPFIDAIPLNSTYNTSVALPANYTLNLAEFFPADMSQYLQYPGSLTTPPCTEGLLWTVFTNTKPIGVQQVLRISYVLATTTREGFVAQRTDNRLIQPLNGRRVWGYGMGQGMAMPPAAAGVAASG